MREHKYKAKRLDGQWVEGYYFAKPILNLHYIILGENQWMIDPDTLCEFTGLTDKNGKYIWENNIIKIYNRNCQITYGAWNFGCCYDVYGWIANYDEFCDEGNKSHGEVIGNIFDNPELLEEC